MLSPMSTTIASRLRGFQPSTSRARALETSWRLPSSWIASRAVLSQMLLRGREYTSLVVDFETDLRGALRALLVGLTSEL